MPGHNFYGSELTIQMPFWNRDLTPPGVDYTNLNGMVEIDEQQNGSTGPLWIALFQWLNKLNPDWLNIRDEQVNPVSGISGRRVVVAPMPAAAWLKIDASDAQIDHWWNCDDMGKYGWITPYNTDDNGDQYMIMPLTWLNCTKSQILFSDEDYDGFIVQLFPGVRADLWWWSYYHPGERLSKVPQVGFRGADAQDIYLHPLTPGAERFDDSELEHLP